MLTRVPHRATNTFTHLQSSLTGIIPADLLANTLIWLDDILLHAPAAEELLASIRLFFALCTKYYIKQHSAKCILFTKKNRWCGDLIFFISIRHGA